MFIPRVQVVVMSNEEDRFRKMVESSPDWFWEFDENACFTYVGPQIRNLLGYDPSELIGLNAFDLMDPGEAERVHEHFDPVAEKSLAGSDVSLWKGPTLNVLLAEDNPVNTQFITKILENLGHEVTLACNGKIAIDLFKANAFDLVLMDIQMPVMDGVDALGILRELEQISKRPLIVIALTAFALIGDQEKYLEMGFNGYLSKPFTTRALVDEMLRVLPSEANLVVDI